jgi:hypothetical protein
LAHNKYLTSTSPPSSFAGGGGNANKNMSKKFPTFIEENKEAYKRQFKYFTDFAFLLVPKAERAESIIKNGEILIDSLYDEIRIVRNSTFLVSFFAGMIVYFFISLIFG